MFAGYRTYILTTVMWALMMFKAFQPEAASELPDEATIAKAVDQGLAVVATVWAILAVVFRKKANKPLFKKEDGNG